MERAALEAYLARGLSLQAIGRLIGRDASTVAYWVKKHGLKANYSDHCAPRGGIPRETLEELISTGLSEAEIAARLDRSASTVKHWLTKFGLQTRRGAQRREMRRAKAQGLQNFDGECRQHGRTVFFLDSQGRYRCLECRRRRVIEHRRKRKQLLVEEAGGRCRLCGYDRCPGALHFHHVDAATKRFALGQRGIARSLVRSREEARKCVLLCANCHAEVEAGVVTLRLDLASLRGKPADPG